MPDLPEVTQTFDADTEPYVRGLSEAIAAAERFRDANIEALASAQMLREGMAGEATAAAQSAAATSVLSGAQQTSATSAADAAKAEYMLAMAERMRANTAREAAAATADSAAATRGATLAIGRWGLTWNAVHWIISGGAELLAVTIPAAIAAAAGAFVMYQGVVEDVGHQLNSVRVATEATASMFHKTAGDVLVGSHAFQTAQNAANPIAYELLGEALAITKSHMVNLAAAGLQVAQALGKLGAEIQVDLLRQGSQFNSLLANMVPDLIQIGQIFGNLGHAMLNFASAMPGLAEVLLRIADAISRVILWISQLPPWLITAVMAFEELNRWGGLLVGVFGRMGIASGTLAAGLLSPVRAMGVLSGLLKAVPMLAATVISNIGSLMTGYGRLGGGIGRAGNALRNFGADMTDAIVAIPAWQVAVGVVAAGALAFLVYKLSSAKDATQQWIDTTNKAVAAASNLQQIGTAAQALGAANQKLAAANDQAAFAQQRMNTSAAQGVVANRAYVGELAQARNDVSALAAEQNYLGSVMGRTITGALTISHAYGVSFVSALALAQAAGVNLGGTVVTLGKHMNVAGAQVDGLVRGYAALAQGGGALSNDMAALTIQAGLQGSKVGQLNQAWDTFMSNATALTSTFATLVTNVAEINNAIATSGQRFTVFGGKVMSSTQAAAMSLRGFSGTSAHVWQNYDQALQQAQQFTDALRLAAAYGAITQTQFTGAVAFAAKQLLPYAKYSKTAAEELSALAQEAGGPATDSYKTLREWVDKNSLSTSQFNKTLQAATGQMGNAQAAAQQFASTLQQALIQQMVTAGMKFSTVNGLINTYSQMLANGTATTARGQGVRAQLIKDFENVGMTAQQAKAMVQLLAGEIAGLHDKTVTVTTQFVQTGSVPSATGSSGSQAHVGVPGGNAAGASYTHEGLSWVNEMGPELIYLPAGSSVTPSWQAEPLMRGGGGGGALNLTTHNVVNVGGQRMQSQVVRQSLIYGRRNSSSNLNLRVR